MAETNQGGLNQKVTRASRIQNVGIQKQDVWPRRHEPTNESVAEAELASLAHEGGQGLGAAGGLVRLIGFEVGE